MTTEEIKQIVEALEPFLELKMKETVSHAKNSLLNEDSDMYTEIKNSHIDIKGELKEVNNHLKTLNGSVAKQQDKLAQHDIINAQTTITQQQIIDSLKEVKTTDLKNLKDSTDINTNFRNKADGSIETFKWLIGLIGIGNIILLLKAFLL